jgi:asparagine synthase (glutamine-hydrolysing)
MRGFQEKYILRRAMRGRLPPEILKRKKYPFTAPFARWLRQDLPDFATDLLSGERLKQKRYFNPGFVLKMLQEHRSGKVNYGRALLAILGVQLWDDLFIRGNKSAI